MTSLKTKIYLIFIVFALMLSLSVALLTHFLVVSSFQKSIQREIILSSEKYSSNIQNQTSMVENYTDSLATYIPQNFDYQKATESETYISDKIEEFSPLVKKLLVKASKLNSAIVSSYIVFNPEDFPSTTNDVPQSWFIIDGNEIKNGPAEPKSFYKDSNPDMQWFFQPKKTGQSLWTEVYNDANTGTAMVSFVEPLYTESHEFIGVAGMDMSLEGIKSELNLLKLPVPGSFFLLDSSGKFIVQPQNVLSQELILKIANLSPAKTSGLISEEENAITYVKLPNNQTLGYITTQKELYKNVTDFQILMGLLLFLFILISFLILYFFVSRQITGPLMELKQAVEKISTESKIEPMKIRSNDEIGKLAKSFNLMNEKLRDSQTNIEAKVAERTKELEKLNRFMTGREIKMIELKKEIETLKKENK